MDEASRGGHGNQLPTARTEPFEPPKLAASEAGDPDWFSWSVALGGDTD